MSCAQCQGIERMFDRRAAERELRQYRAAGPGGTTRLLIDALKAEGVAGLTLLDIGGGVGAIQHELLRAGSATPPPSTRHPRTLMPRGQRWPGWGTPTGLSITTATSWRWRRGSSRTTSSPSTG